MNELIDIENNRINHLVSREYDLLSAYLSDDLVYVHSVGLVENKQEHVENLKSGFYGYESLRWLQQGISLHDDVAIIQGVIEWKNWFDDTPEQELQKAATLVVYVKEGPSWRLKNWQTTKAI